MMMMMMTRQNLQLVVTIVMIYKALFQSSVTASEVISDVGSKVKGLVK